MKRSLFLTSILASAQLAAQGYDFAAAARYSANGNGHALLVVERGKTVFETYANGWSSTKSHRLASGTKSVTGVIAAFAVQDRLLSLEEKLVDVIPEWKNDRRKSQVTYRQLLSLSSGITGGTIGVVPSYAQAIQAKTIADPGKAFSYGPVPFQIFGEALRRKLVKSKRSVAQYIRDKLITPLGLKPAAWTGWLQGEPRLPSGLFLTARDWAVFGEFVRKGGQHGGKDLLDAMILGECFKVSRTNASYRMTWWGATPKSPTPKDMVYAAGAGKQRCYLIPSLGLTIIRFGESNNRNFNDTAFFAALMPAATMRFGKACAGTVGAPALDGVGLPRIGRSLVLEASSVPLPSLGALVLGASHERFLGRRLPFALDGLGAKGCSLFVSIDLLLPFSSSQAKPRLRLPIPNEQALRTERIFAQVLMIDAKANAAGMTTSNGLAIRFGQ